MSTHNICFCGEIRKIFCSYRVNVDRDKMFLNDLEEQFNWDLHCSPFFHNNKVTLLGNQMDLFNFSDTHGKELKLTPPQNWLTNQ